VGATVDVAVGGTLDEAASPRVRLRATVELLREGTAAGGVALLAEGGVRVLVGERRLGMTHPGQLRDLGLEPLVPGQILVLKIGYLFPAYADLVGRTPGARSLLLRTPGATGLDPRAFSYGRTRRPLYPLDDVAAPQWETSSRAGGPLGRG
jgi:microcystin degradation protein MlrC